MKQIIASGDGGLDGNNPLMDLYIIAQSRKKNPKVCLLPTAGGDDRGTIKYFLQLYDRYPCDTSYLTLFNPHTADIEDFIRTRDIIFVSGGQSKTMLGVWREWGVDKFLRAAYEGGTILSGGSAGSVCWFRQCITDSIPGDLTVMNCLDIIPYSNCPHFASTSRRASYARHVAQGKIMGGYAADDFAALHFIDEKYHRSVSSNPYAKTFKYTLDNNRLVQQRLKTYWLDIPEYQEQFIFNSPSFSNDIDSQTE